MIFNRAGAPALIAPGAFLWITFVVQAGYSFPSGMSRNLRHWSSGGLHRVPRDKAAARLDHMRLRTRQERGPSGAAIHG
jgi:hypothetical protein